MPTNFAKTARYLARNGYAPIPIQGKRPYVKNWTTKTPESLVTLARSQHYRDCGTGIRCGDFVTDEWVLAALDFDVDDQPFVDAVVARAHDLGAPLRFGRAGRCLVLVQVPANSASTSQPLVNPDRELKQIDILINGRQFAAYGQHPDGFEYRWENGEPLEMPALALPKLSDPLRFIRDCLSPGWNLMGKERPSTITEIRCKCTEQQLADLKDALSNILADDRDLWVRMGHALKPLADAGKELWFEWSRTSVKFDPADAERVWNSLDPSQTDFRAVFAEAGRHGWQNPGRASRIEAETQASSHSGMLYPEYSTRQFDWMPIPLDLLTSGAVAVTASPEAYKAAIFLLAESWRQHPGGTLPDDDYKLARLTGLPLEIWRRLRDEALQEWVRCPDGRYYHPGLRERVTSMATERLRSVESGRRGGQNSAGRRTNGKPPSSPPSVVPESPLEMPTGGLKQE